MQNDELRDKPNFVLALLASGIALVTLKEELSGIMLPLGLWQVNLMQLAIAFTTLLGIASYFYAMDYLRSYKLLQKARIILSLANFFYLIAILFPLLVVFAWGVSAFIVIVSQFLTAANNKVLTEVTLFLVYTFAFFATYYPLMWAMNLTRDMEQKSAKKQDEITQLQLEKATQLYINKVYGPAIIEIYNTIKARLKSMLMLKGYRVYNVPTFYLLEDAAKEKIITHQDVHSILEIKKMKEQAVHFVTFEKKDADFALNIAKQILKKTAL